MSGFKVTDQQVRQFEQDGYLMVEDLFSGEEVALLSKIARTDAALVKASRTTKDAAGAETRLALRNDLGDDIYSAIVRSHRVVNTMESLLGGEVYHFHHKMMQKEPFVGGAWEWHQDFGYWYKNNFCLFPSMASCYIAVDQANKENGCLQVIKGSHKCGRIEHGVTGTQTGADSERVAALLERLELVYCEMRPGTALFFHSNLLHRSDQNRSPNPRWGLICCYNTADNSPYKERQGGHPSYHYLERWDDAKVMETGRKQLEAIQGATTV